MAARRELAAILRDARKSALLRMRSLLWHLILSCRASSSALARNVDVQDRGAAALCGRKRAFERALELVEPLDVLAVEAEMAAELLVLGSVDGDAVVQVLAGRG